MKPFLKWAGGKRWFVNNYSHLLCKNFERYIEPFLGSGSVFFHICPKTARLSDLNKNLIYTYKAIRDDPESVLSYLQYHQKHHSTNHYYKIRSTVPKNIYKQAARLIYLNRTCFNGLYRVNMKGLFNVPIGSKTSVIFEDDDFISISRILENVDLQNLDFEQAISFAEKNDFLYVDPPYTVRHYRNGFLKYNERIFSWQDQQKLAKCLNSAANRGVYILLSNADHPSISKLYSADRWKCIKLNRHSVIASKAQHRRQTSELVISNYFTEKELASTQTLRFDS